MSTVPTVSSVRRALIVHAHPEPGSFSTAQAAAAAAHLRSRGVAVDTIDLYAHGWDPTLSRTQFASGSGYFKPQVEQMRQVSGGVVSEPVGSHLELLQGADLLILSFPLWWFSMPAILKGWVDRVFVMGALFGGEHGILRNGAMRGKKAMVLLTTGGDESAFRPGAADGFGDLDAFLFHVHRGMFEFVGYDVVPPFVTYGPARLDAEARADALAQVPAHLDSVLDPTSAEQPA